MNKNIVVLNMGPAVNFMKILILIMNFFSFIVFSETPKQSDHSLNLPGK